jgi:hypothetical protein
VAAEHEGIMAKQRSSRYRPGRRLPAWRSHLLLVRVIRVVAQASKWWVIDCEFVSDLDEVI